MVKSEKRKASKSSSSNSDSDKEEDTSPPKVAKIDLLRKQKSQPSLGIGM